jgi:hypothetical protein
MSRWAAVVIAGVATVTLSGQTSSRGATTSAGTTTRPPAPPAPILRPPAVPLVAHDPYFSIWSPADRLTDAATVHWTGKAHPLTSLIRVDGETWRLMGPTPTNIAAMAQTSLAVKPTRTIYTFASARIKVTLTFMTPALPSDLDVLSRPVTYISWDVASADGKPHQVQAYFDCGADIAVNTTDQQVQLDYPKIDGLAVARVGTPDQPVLGRKGDDVRIDWGYGYLAAPSGSGSMVSGGNGGRLRTGFTNTGTIQAPGDPIAPAAVSAGRHTMAAAWDMGVVGAQPSTRYAMLAYDDIKSIRYFEHDLVAWWRRNGATIDATLAIAARDRASLDARAKAFDADLQNDLESTGGAKYAQVAMLAYRQTLAATKLVADTNGQPLLFPKENFSNGCIATVDVIYPMAPEFLLFGPALAKAMVVSNLDYASSARWKFPFAPHDLGTYPWATGQVYGGGERTEDNQMPVEETGNIMILVAAISKMEGNADFAGRYWPVLTKWAEYLRDKGFDPENQLSTDDFAGHLAHNVNLSAKAIVALGAYAQMAGLHGDKAAAADYRTLAERFAARWVKEADDGDHFRLAFDQPGTWSQKYNMVWDRVLGLNLFPAAVAQKEMAFYRRTQNTYGLALDNRRLYTKLDWITWTATLTGSRADFEALVSPVFDFLNTTPHRVPMSDWYWTHDATHTGFQARSVVGGVFLKLLYDDAVWKKWAGHDRRDGPITRWDEALPLGNGLLGALVWGENSVVRISLDRGDLWDLRIPDELKHPDWTYATIQRLHQAGDQKQLSALFDVPYDQIPYPTKLPGGRIELTFDPSVHVSSFALNEKTASAHVDAGSATIDARVDAVMKAGLFEINGPQPEVRLIRPAGLDKLGYGPAAFASDANTWTLKQDAALGLSYVVAVSRRPTPTGARYAFTIAASRKGEDVVASARATVSAALDASDAQARHAHEQWWSRFWSTSTVSVPDARIQTQYDTVKYFYGAASRADAPPMPLQGVWTADAGGLAPWKGDYHHDLNTQMTYLAYHEAGLRESGASSLNQMWDLLPRFKAFAKTFYGVDGAVVPGVMAIDGQALGGWSQYSLSPTNGAWNAQSFYLEWKYTQDAAFLHDRAYPWCTAVGDALAHLLTPDAAGRLKLPLSTSPEIFDNSARAWLTPNTNYDLSLMRFLFAANAEMADALADKTAAARWRSLLARLDPLDRDPTTGALTFARGVPFDQSHRHFSHAMAIYPLGTLNIEGSDSDRATIGLTLDQIESRGTKQWVGYSFAWYSAMAARAGQADRALTYLQTFVRAFTGPNGFHLNGDQTKTGLSSFTYRPFTLEGNFLAMQAVHEMLLQSWGGVVRVFPAVSDQWRDVSFRDLRAEGGFVVTAERKAGRTTRVNIRATHPVTLHLRDPFAGATPTWNRVDLRRDGRDVVVTLAAGESLAGSAPAGRSGHQR